jgi:hypothetical protein
MTWLLDFLNRNSGALTALFSLVVSAATVFYAVLTRRLVSETARMREAQTEPSVAIRIEPHEAHLNIIMLVIENVGPGPAYDVSLTCEPDFIMHRAQPVSGLGFFKHGFKYLAPGQRLRTFLTSIAGKGDEISDLGGRYRFEIKVSYRSALGAKYKGSYPIDFLHLLGMSTLGTPPLHQIADNVKKLAESVSHLESGWKRMRVDVYSSRDREKEAEEWEAYRNQQIAEQERASQTAPELPAPEPETLAESGREA